MTKEEKDLEAFKNNYVKMVATYGEAHLENAILGLRNERRLAIQAENDARLEESKITEAANEAKRLERIAEYYACCLERPNFYITAQEIITGDYINDHLNHWENVFRNEANPYDNPYLSMDVEQQLFFLGVTDVKMILKGGMRPDFPEEMLGLKLKDVMTHFKPIEETSGLFVDEIPKIREKIQLYKDSLETVE